MVNTNGYGLGLKIVAKSPHSANHKYGMTSPDRVIIYSLMLLKAVNAGQKVGPIFFHPSIPYRYHLGVLLQS